MSSKIKVDTIENVAGSGNVSLGSGHNLVVPGNQTVGGTLGVTGTMAGASTLSLNGVSAQTTYAIQTQTKPIYLSSTDTTYADVTLKKGAATTVDYLQLRDDSNNLDFKIDSVGRFIADRQPSFKAQRSGSNVTSGTVVFNLTSHNIGNHYSTSTGRFTAPVSGRYIFSLVAMAQNDYFRGQIFVNSSGITQFRTDHDGAQDMNYMQATITVIYNLAANDYVFMQVDAGTAGGNTAEMQFYGHLLG